MNWKNTDIELPPLDKKPILICDNGIYSIGTFHSDRSGKWYSVKVGSNKRDIDIVKGKPIHWMALTPPTDEK